MPFPYHQALKGYRGWINQFSTSHEKTMVSEMPKAHHSCVNFGVSRIVFQSFLALVK